MISRLSKNTKKAIHGLATAYQVYVAALLSEDSEDRDLSISVWGKILIDRQRELGVEMLDVDGLGIVIDRADARLAERRRVAA